MVISGGAADWAAQTACGDHNEKAASFGSGDHVIGRWVSMNATPTQMDWLNGELDAWKVGRHHSIAGAMYFG